MGAFDDLIPGGAAPAAGAFDDLIPGAQKIPPATITQRHAGGRGGPGADKVMVSTTNYAPAEGAQGAPLAVRLRVGNSPPQDRLTNLRTFYPEAEPIMARDHTGNLVPTDNFQFPNKESGKWDYYNPPGFDVGDIPSIGRDLVTGAGAAMSGLAAGVTSGPASPVTVPVAAGAGGLATGQAFDAVQRALGQIDTRGAGQRAYDATMDFLANAAGEVFGPILREVPKMPGRGVKGFLRGGTPEGQQVMADATDLGIDPRAGMVTPSGAVHRTEAALRDTPGATDVVIDESNKTIDQIANARNRIADTYAGGAASEVKDAPGRVLQSGAQDAADAMKARYGKMYDTAYNMVGLDMPVDLTRLKVLRDDFAKELALTPTSRPKYNAIVAEMDKVLTDAAANGGKLPLGAVVDIKSDLGKLLNSYDLSSQQVANLDRLRKQFFGEFADTVDAQVAAANPQAAKLLDQAKKLTTAYKNAREPVLADIAGAKTPEAAFDLALRSSKQGPTLLRKLRHSLAPERWDELAGAKLRQMGFSKNARGEDAFSPEVFMREWKELKKSGAADVLFSGQRYTQQRAALDKLINVVEAADTTAKLANRSGTGRVMLYGGLMQTLGMGGGGAVAGVPGAMAGAAGSVVLPYSAAKLMNHPRFVRWLSEAISTPNPRSKPLGLLENLSRLGLMNWNDDMRSDVDAYIADVKKQVQAQ